MHVELPAMMEQLKASAPAPKPSPEQERIAALEAQLAKFQESQAAAATAQVQDIHKRKASAPPGVPTVATTAAGAGTEVPNFKSAAEARKWLRDHT
jgi:hypothetical protein